MNFQTLMFAVLLLSLASAGSLMLIVESSGGQITVKEGYALSYDETSVPSSDYVTHILVVGGKEYPVALDVYTFNEVPTSDLYDEQGNQKYMPPLSEILTKDSSVISTIVVPLPSGVDKVTITDLEKNVVATFSVANAKDYDATFKKTAPKQLPVTKQIVKSTSGGNAVTPPTTKPVSNQVLWQMIVDVLVELFKEALGL